MSDSHLTCPLQRSQAIDMYFMEHRAKLIDIAAFLDRLDRSAGGYPKSDDFRMIAFRNALEIVTDDQPDRARRVLELFSDPTEPPIAKASMKGALGAYLKAGR